MFHTVHFFSQLFLEMINWLKNCVAGVSAFWTGTTTSSTGSLLPSRPHVQLGLYQLKPRLVVVGDVHGCLDELKELLAKLNYSPETTSVILVGDLISKGPYNREVIQYVKSNGFFSVRGNHEDNALLARYRPGSKYAKRKADYDLSEDEMQFIRQLPISISIPELSLLIVHAGLDSGKRGYPVERQDFSDLIRIRSIGKKGDTSKEGPNGDRKLWASMYAGPPFVVFGHDAKRRLQVHPWARGIDTGCVYGGSLTGLLIEDLSHNWMTHAEIISVHAKKIYAEKDED